VLKKRRIETHKNAIYFKNEKILIDTWFVETGEDYTFNQVKSKLEEVNIPYSENQEPGTQIGRKLVTKSGVNLLFDDWFAKWKKGKNGRWFEDKELNIGYEDYHFVGFSKFKSS